MRRTYLATALVLVLVASVLGQSSGGSFRVTQSVVANGGAQSTGGNLTVTGTAGQPAAGTALSNSPFSQTGGFWPANSPSAPTAAPASISGQVFTNNGLPLAGVVMTLAGPAEYRTVTDASGAYSFSSVAVGSFYTITPFRTNYTFAPASRSLSLVANTTNAVFSARGDAVALGNPLDTPEFFVRQQYIDLLGREPDQDGFNYWSTQINLCGAAADCLRARRLDVAAAFFMETEFQASGSFIYDLYASALGRRPVFAEYLADRQQVIGGANLETEKSMFVMLFAQREEFVQRYQTNTTAESFVEALLQNASRAAGIDLTSERETLTARYHSGANQTESRAFVLRDLADSATLRQAEYNSAFVLTEYFAYLRRDPDQAGYDFWLNVLNNGAAGNYRGMVCSFVTSAEYQQRFSAVVTRSNVECAFDVRQALACRTCTTN